MDSSDPSLAVDNLHADRHRQFRRHERGPTAWVVYAPLPPLALMLFTGLYMFALPYVAGGRGGRTQEKRA
jgi:hypothetical protein